ncbi:MAG: peptide/nickel transport system substrate-binding protein [Patescibacteria group bacterium]|nr:peptide/nickel transport system substrate-binding protein [Patescibacteria group bacterium]
MSISTELSSVARSLPLSKKIIILVLLIIGGATIISSLWKLNNTVLVGVPENGGVLREGVIGAPRFINPLLAISDTDRDLSAVIYSGLMRKGTDGQFIPDLAERFDISNDGKTYTFYLRKNLTWHDGKPITANDVVFTINKAVDPAVKSPKAINWEGVGVTAQSDRVIIFNLPQPYSAFIGETTIGILPSHIWGQIASETLAFSELNAQPIGSGPYMIKSVKYSSDGLPIYYNLSAFKDFALGKAHIEEITFYFYPNEEELIDAAQKNIIDNLGGITPLSAQKLQRFGAKVKQTPLPRVFGIFWNQNEAKIFTQSEVRKALEQSLDRKYIVENILENFATPIDGPLPPSSIGYEKKIGLSEPIGLRIQKAKNLLTSAGWEKGSDGILQKTVGKETLRLEFTITTADTTELKAIARLAENTWEKMGAKVTIKVQDLSDLQQTSIRPRKYDALLFGMSTGADSDLYSFWHSSERSDPGLNVAMYANPSADKLLEKIKTEQNRNLLAGDIKKLNTIIRNDHPAVFIYSPDFIYVISEDIREMDLPYINIPADRFAHIYDWYLATDKVWPFFAPDNTASDTASTTKNI